MANGVYGIEENGWAYCLENIPLLMRYLSWVLAKNGRPPFIEDWRHEYPKAWGTLLSCKKTNAWKDYKGKAAGSLELAEVRALGNAKITNTNGSEPAAAT